MMNRFTKSRLMDQRSYDNRVRSAYRAVQLYVDALNDLSDVNTAGATDGSIIEYDEGTGTWRAVSKKHIGFLYTSGIKRINVSSGMTTLNEEDSMAGVVVLTSTIDTVLMFSAIAADKFYNIAEKYDSRIVIVDNSGSTGDTTLGFHSSYSVSGESIIGPGDKAVLYWTWEAGQWNIHSVIIKTSADIPVITAAGVSFDDTFASLSAGTVQEAIDRLTAMSRADNSSYAMEVTSHFGVSNPENLDTRELIFRTGLSDTLEVPVFPPYSMIPESWEGHSIGAWAECTMIVPESGLTVSPDMGTYDGVFVVTNFMTGINPAGTKNIKVEIHWVKVHDILKIPDTTTVDPKWLVPEVVPMGAAETVDVWVEYLAIVSVSDAEALSEPVMLGHRNLSEITSPMSARSNLGIDLNKLAARGVVSGLTQTDLPGVYMDVTSGSEGGLTVAFSNHRLSAKSDGAGSSSTATLKYYRWDEGSSSWVEWEEFLSATSGDILYFNKNLNFSDVNNKTAARSNLGLGYPTKSQAEAGTLTTGSMTPQRTKEAISYQRPIYVTETSKTTSGGYIKYSDNTFTAWGKFSSSSVAAGTIVSASGSIGFPVHSTQTTVLVSAIQTSGNGFRVYNGYVLTASGAITVFASKEMSSTTTSSSISGTWIANGTYT